MHNRLCRLAITYQDDEAERGIVALRAPLPDLKPAVDERLVADAGVTRATREHEDIRQGNSVRGAIDLTLIAWQLLTLSSERTMASVPDETRYRDVVYDATIVALSGRIFLTRPWNRHWNRSYSAGVQFERGRDWHAGHG